MITSLQDIPHKYNNIALIATGGGNDIKSALSTVKFLTSQGAKVDLFGVLSPGAYHTFDGKPEQIINPLTKHMRRFVGAYHKEISFDDIYIPELIKKLDMHIGNCYELSIKRGNQNTSKAFNQFAHQQGYDGIFLEDVGGDILGRIKEDKHIISPLMDHTMLHIAGESPLDSYLREFGIGTDGELDDIEGVLQDIKHNGALLETGTFTSSDDVVIDLTKIHDYLVRNNQRLGNTIPRTVQTFTETDSITTQHLVYHKFGKKERSNYRTVLLDKKYFGKHYLINAKKLHQVRKETSTKGFPTLLDQWIHYKTLSEEWKTEMDGLIDTISNSLMLCISNNFQGKSRNEIIEAGLEEFEESEINSAYMYSKDTKEMNHKSSYTYSEVNEKICKLEK